MSIPATTFPDEDNNAAASDSDSNPDELPEDYQPLSADENSDSDSDLDHSLPNGYTQYHASNGISSLNLNNVVEAVEEQQEQDVDVEEEEEASDDTEILRAFREDENRRNAPLPVENARRVMDAMRGVSFGGVVPDWANRVGEDQWITQLRLLSQLSAQKSSTSRT